MKDRKFWFVIASITVVFLAYWLLGHPYFVTERFVMLFAIVSLSSTLLYFIRAAERGEEFYLRPIPALKAVEEAVGRSTEMGRPILYVPGIQDMDQVETVAGVVVLGHVAKMTARYETSLNVPVSRSIVMKAARESCREAYMLEGRPDMFHEDMVKILPKLVNKTGIINVGGKAQSVYNFGKLHNKKITKTICTDKNLPLKQTMNLGKLKKILN